MIGDTVKKLRLRKGITQEELAKALAVKQQNIEQLENGKVGQPRYLKKLADYFDVSIDQLYSGDVDTQVGAEGRKKAHAQIEGLSEDECLVLLKLIETVFRKSE